MNNILGLSHLVFTINSENIHSLKGTILEDYFGDGDYFEFDHTEIRRKLIRNDINIHSKISLFKPLNSNLPAIEFLYSKNDTARPLNTFGLILKNLNVDKKYLANEFKFEEFYFAKCFLDSKLNIYVSHDTNLIESEYGCWITVKDFEAHKKLLTSIKSNLIISNDNNKLIVKCRVINSKFSTFTIVLLRDTLTTNNFFNDDLGLSTIGWIQKSNDKYSEDSLFQNTNTFQISIFDRIFKAKFLYNNSSISHELLNIV